MKRNERELVNLNKSVTNKTPKKNPSDFFPCRIDVNSNSAYLSIRPFPIHRLNCSDFYRHAQHHQQQQLYTLRSICAFLYSIVSVIV